MPRLQRRPADRRIGHDQRVDLPVQRHGRDVLHILRLQIGRDLEEDRWPAFAPLGNYRLQQRVERSLVLQRAQPGRVGRRDIDRQIIRQPRHRPHAQHVIRDPVRTVLVRADIDPDDPPRRRFASRTAAAACPRLLKPSRLITAASCASRNSRGLGLPAWGSGVSVPTSTKPKPSPSICA
jgi:hypothetical protein